MRVMPSISGKIFKLSTKSMKMPWLEGSGVGKPLSTRVQNTVTLTWTPSTHDHRPGLPTGQQTPEVRCLDLLPPTHSAPNEGELPGRIVELLGLFQLQHPYTVKPTDNMAMARPLMPDQSSMRRKRSLRGSSPKLLGVSHPCPSKSKVWPHSTFHPCRNKC